MGMERCARKPLRLSRNPLETDFHNPESARIAKRNGVGVATGNLAIRRLGIPTVTVPMGLAEDISMPFGITFAGAAYTDLRLVSVASVFEALRNRPASPPRTP